MKAHFWKIDILCGAMIVAGMVALSGQPSQPAAVEEPTDRTLPVPPYLQALSPRTMAILWETDSPAYGWIEYGETAALGRRQDAARFGLRDANSTCHRITLAGLEPGTTYYYRVHWRPIRSFKAYQVDFGPDQSTEIAAFRTLPGRQDRVAAVVFNDLHNNIPTFQALCRAVSTIPFDFSLFNGDCLVDLNEESRALAVMNEYIGGIQAGRRSAFFIRGNHETRGAYARLMPRLFAWPGDRPYFAFNAGPVRWVVLDCGEDKPDDNVEYSGLVNFATYRQEQTPWLKREIASPAFRRAPWRVLVHHMPIYPARTKGNGGRQAQDLWNGILANAGIDLALNAHTHRTAFHPPFAIGNPFPVAIGGAPTLKDATVMLLEADPNQLKLRILDASGNDRFPPFLKTR